MLYQFDDVPNSNLLASLVRCLLPLSSMASNNAIAPVSLSMDVQPPDPPPHTHPDLSTPEETAPQEPALPSTGSSSGAAGSADATAAVAVEANSISMLVVLLDLHYTALAHLMAKVMLLHTLEVVVERNNVTFFVPWNMALEGFLLESRSLMSLQALLLYNVLSSRLPSDAMPVASHPTLSGLVAGPAAAAGGGLRVGHGIECLLVPRSRPEDLADHAGLLIQEPAHDTPEDKLVAGEYHPHQDATTSEQARAPASRASGGQ